LLKYPQKKSRLFSAISQVSKDKKVINIDERLEDKLKIMDEIGLAGTVNQYEMELIISCNSLYII